MYNGHRQRSVSKRSMRWIIAACIIGISIISYFLFSRNGVFASKEGVIDTIIAVETTEDTLATDKKLTDAVQTKEEKPLPDKDARIIAAAKKPKVLKKEKDITLSDQQNEGEKIKDKLSPTVYKVISIAYFHNEPDEQTRRKAFINHWNNSYASIEALDEKNGFIYVVFTNKAGQTSKGWLKKTDLKEVK